jgi:hypothetical protein
MADIGAAGETTAADLASRLTALYPQLSVTDLRGPGP